MKEYRPSHPFARAPCGDAPTQLFPRGVFFRGVLLTQEELDFAEDYVIENSLVVTRTRTWRWWEVTRVLEEAYRNRILGVVPQD